jgi:hypothetical protein
MKPQPFNLHIPGCLCCPGLSILTEAFVMLRRLFLLGAGSFATAIALGGRAEANPSQPQPQLAQGNRFADSIYINGTVITVNDQQPIAEAVAVKDGRILAVGDRRMVKALQRSATQVFDLQGKTLVPGFIDPHGHVFRQGVAALVADLPPPPDGDVDSIAKLQDKLQAWSQTPTMEAFEMVSILLSTTNRLDGAESCADVPSKI